MLEICTGYGVDAEIGAEVITRPACRLLPEWQRKWDCPTEQRGRFLHKIKPKVSLVSWLSQLPVLRRAHLIALSRLRSGHALFPAHRFRIGLAPSADCVCGVTGSLNHIFFGCSLNPHCDQFYWSLSRYLHLPIYIATVLEKADKISSINMIKFTSSSKLKL